MKFELIKLPRNCSNEEIIAEIKRVDSILNKKKITRMDFDAHGKISSSQITKRFGGWKNVLVASGLSHKYSDRVRTCPHSLCQS
jgi:hypothetical protein